MKFYYLFVFCLCFGWCNAAKRRSGASENSGLTGIIFSSNKDIVILSTVLKSVIEHLNFASIYVVVQGDHFKAVKKEYASRRPFQRIKVINEDWLSIPIPKEDVVPIMVEAVHRSNIYRVLSFELQEKQREERQNLEAYMKDWSYADKQKKLKEKNWKAIPPSDLEKYITANAGWFWQQLLKLLIGRALRLPGDYVVLDGDVVWHKSLDLVHKCRADLVQPAEGVLFGSRWRRRLATWEPVENRKRGKKGADLFGNLEQQGKRLPHKVIMNAYTQEENPTLCSYNYATSFQYHEPYLETLQRMLGIDLLNPTGLSRFKGFGPGDNSYRNDTQHLSGIVHHMAFSRPVLESMLVTVENLPKHTQDTAMLARFVDAQTTSEYTYSRPLSAVHEEQSEDGSSSPGGKQGFKYGWPPSRIIKHPEKLTFAEIFLMHAANALVCGKGIMCEKKQVVSEYELYFQYARIFFPQTVNLRPLLWANGPRPGLLYWPTVKAAGDSWLTRRWAKWTGTAAHSDYTPAVAYYDVRNEKNWVAAEEPATTAVRAGTVPSLGGLRQLNFDRQVLVDAAHGYDYVAYHNHSSNRNYEVPYTDVYDMCTPENYRKYVEKHVTKMDGLFGENACSLKGRIDNMAEHDTDWHLEAKELGNTFRGCACNDMHQVYVRKKEH